jgi:hypothetical protein
MISRFYPFLQEEKEQMEEEFHLLVGLVKEKAY